MINLELETSQVDTILAALRAWQTYKETGAFDAYPKQEDTCR